MSKHETPLTRAYWRQTGGTLIEEYPVVPRGRDRAGRWLDGLIILDDRCRILPSHQDHGIDLAGLDLVCVQTKRHRVGMNLLGQAFFSMRLLEARNPRSIRSVALCTRADACMAELVEDIPNLDIQVIDPVNLEIG